MKAVWQGWWRRGRVVARSLQGPVRSPAGLGEPRFRTFDEPLAWVIVALLTIGLVMVYSASIAYADADRATHSRFYYLIRHALSLGVALGVGWCVFRVPTRVWQRWAPKIFLLAIVLLALVLVPGIGKVVNGSRRWISLGFMNLQPSELMKLAVVVYAADFTSRKAVYLQGFFLESLWKGFVPMAGAIVLVGGLLLAEPDFGAFAVVAVIAMATLFLGGINGRIFFGLLIIGAVAAVGLVVSSPYRMERVVGFLDPWQDPYGKGYQLSHSLIAFGRGEWFGVGLGQSVEKLFYLPEAHTDFLMAVIGEEFGFAGIATVVGLFAWLVWRAFHIGRESRKLERHFQALAAQAIGIWIGWQCFINIGVNLGLLPTKGLTLPLLSYGGSAILANCMALAILLRIDWENRLLMRGYKV
ncbi:putative lipid II flippase FtsW [Laribacter hongkongensis]|uniref:Probable peptidoglycan glycosyltransferase FtsW n=1 Tax=Laribacter hongkongensis TaxID=168471 RepID=A0ABD4SPG3_9NEIS|nr:putative lipid II flippase FtsW [Laribacter hongkongensis]MCG9024887.1 putative lipid II flippase FtsW [Laribacter hongkongensis]MCG9101506.1 putative lipid II flippase FtsW [Laribacter hongkongensis]MCG9102391.1 putative lipid II flippase FtsW [Laribacter hongkongensis]MCG9112433.1 putative lipid II flippase FtsW [Laribacter hongkongensis]MCG9119315.1 putative lipid II flippase FtsW [Laribacter hongkongensis]